VARTNLILLVVAVVCALGTVASNHRARSLFAELEREQARMRDLDVEWGQLQLEQSTWANHARVEKIARERLHMKTPDQVIVLDATPPAAGERK
jgi:cell division protein FtsL